LSTNETCIFCKIANGEIPAATVYEDGQFRGFLDNSPLFPGHVLLCPHDHYATLPDLPAEMVGPMFTAGQLLTQAVETALGAEGTFLAINNKVSQTVPHLHLHIVPRRRKDGLRGFFWPRNSYKDAQHTEEIRAAIENEVKRLRGTA
jgi:histidine triad (HIT) family protein